MVALPPGGSVAGRFPAGGHAVDRSGGRDALPWIAAALLLYLVAFVVTIAVNVPLNDGIKAAGDPGRIADLGAVRARFDEARWRGWNLCAWSRRPRSSACSPGR
jgi:uncharacterized membrane protein